MFELDDELAELKRAVGHMDMGLKAIRVEMREGIDYKRLAASLQDQVRRIRSIADQADARITEELKLVGTQEG